VLTALYFASNLPLALAPLLNSLPESFLNLTLSERLKSVLHSAVIAKGNDLMKVPITRRTVKQRLLRALQAQGKHLRGTSWRNQRKLGLGRYYIADANGVIDPDVDLEDLARALGVMQSWETLKAKPPSHRLAATR
jgi:hypothetical protein